MQQALKTSHYHAGLAIIILLAAILRFWQLGEFRQLVFDEVYFAKFAHNYLTGTYFFDSHPPLSKYLIAIGIWLHNHLPWVSDVSYQTAELTDLSAISWRWLNALTGTLLCLLAAKLSLLLYPSRILALVIALFVAIDGMFIVESRFGLNNIYLVTLGVCALFFLMKSFDSTQERHGSLVICGVFLGLTYSIKWSGLGYSLAAWMLVFLPIILFYFKKYQLLPEFFPAQLHQLPLFTKTPLWLYVACLFLVPLLVYSILWWPHVEMFTKHGFIEMQRQIMGYHSTGVTADEHAYCSPWYSWPLMIRPISYYFEASNTAADVSTHRFTAVHLLGNPVLLWCSALAMFALFFLWLNNLLAWFRRGVVNDGFIFQSVVIVGFSANWLPWSIVGRCLFQYHYLASALFAFMALAWFLAKCLESSSHNFRFAGVFIILLIIACFIYWLPLNLGIPLIPAEFHERMWLKSWV